MKKGAWAREDGVDPSRGPAESRIRTEREVATPTFGERRLAAILAADVAGYSRLVGADELGTLARWQAHWDKLIEPTIKAHHGRIVRVTGDGILAEFASVVNAVRCAVLLQRGMADRNADVERSERIEFRMGINVGDIIIDRGDIWGEGVNLAARLEAFAEPGGICVSGRVQEDVQGKLPVSFEDLGGQQFKNIARPVRVYRVRYDQSASAVVFLPLPNEPSFESISKPHRSDASDASDAVDSIQTIPVSRAARPRRWRVGRARAAIAVIAVGAAVAGAWWQMSASRLSPSAPADNVAVLGSETSREPTADKTATSTISIAVLPFLNLSTDTQQDYLADGITESLMTDLTRALPGSFVVSRTTAFTYKGRPVDVRQIRQELGVRYLLEGSLLPDADRIRVNAQLIDAASGGHLWAERFDVNRSKLLEVQDEIVGRLSRAVGLRMIDSEARRSERERARNPEAIDLVMRGKAIANRPATAASMIGARDLFEQALNVEQDNPEALAGVATTYIFEVLNGYYETGNEQRLQRAEQLLIRALETDPRQLVALKAKAALLRAQGHFDDAIGAAKTVIAENPGEPWAYKEIGLSTMYLGQAEEGLDWFAKADQIGPRDPTRWTWLDGRGHALILLGRDEEALRFLQLAVDANPHAVSTRAFLAAAYALVGRPDDASAALARYSQFRPGETVANFRRLAPVPLRLTSPQYQQQVERLKDGLRKAGMPD